jgi:hypothetical protein
MRPPPPTMASIKPASSDAAVTKSHSILSSVSKRDQCEAGFSGKKKRWGYQRLKKSLAWRDVIDQPV